MSCDVIVVGGGVIGLSCAWLMAKNGLKVTLCEQRRCGAGASGAAVGALWPPAPSQSGLAQTLHRTSLWKFEAFAQELTEFSGIDLKYERCGRIELFTDDRKLENAGNDAHIANKEWPMAEGIQAWEVLSAHELYRAQPALALGRFVGAIRCNATAKVSVDRLIAALRISCEKAGVNISEGNKVVSLIEVCSKVEGVLTERGALNCSIVVVAAGAWSAGLGEIVRSIADVKPVRGQALSLRVPLRTRKEIIKDGSIYLIPCGANTLLVGSTTESQSGFDESVTQDGLMYLLNGAKNILPELENAHVTRHWSGLRPKPRSDRPYIGAVNGVAGLYIAAGHYKTGLGMAPISAQMIVDEVLSSYQKECLSSTIFP